MIIQILTGPNPKVSGLGSFFMKRNIFFVFLSSVLVLSLLHCSFSGDANQKSQMEGSVSVSVPAALQVGALLIVPQSIKVSVAAADMNSILTSFDPADFPEDNNGVITVSLDVPVGDNRIFVVEVEGQDEGRGYRGTATANVPEGGASVQIDTSFLNFFRDDAADIFPNGAQDLTDVDWSGTENAGSKTYDIFIAFSNAQNPEGTQVLMFFDKDANTQTGSGDFLNNPLDGLQDPLDFGAETFLKVLLNGDQNPLTSDVQFLDAVTGDLFAFNNGDASGTATWDAGLDLLTITLNEPAADELLGDRGFFNVLVGDHNPNTGGIIAADFALDSNTAIYDLKSFFNEGPLDE
ncbi:MAG TPA: hypothetical protein DDW49_04020 [Deltaproteobacteria bacterium]|nr:hypothetical protein [Deltaproteobacteria bacterium]